LIKEFLETNETYNKGYALTSKCVSVVCKPNQEEAKCLDCFTCCDFYQKVFSNDEYCFTVYKQIEADTIDVKLIKNGAETILDGSNYSTIKIDGLRYYYCINWNNIINDLGEGPYEVKICTKVLGVENEKSIFFNACFFDECLAQGTVKIEFWIDGELKNGAFFCNDYYSFRVDGITREVTPTINNEFYLNKNLKLTKQSSEVICNYELQIKDNDINEEIKNLLAHADRIKLTADVLSCEIKPFLNITAAELSSFFNSKKKFWLLNFEEADRSNRKINCNTSK